MAPNKEASTCLACSKKFGKSDFSVQCTVCGLWIHKTCANLTDEMFKFLDDQFKLTGMAFWACRACTQYAKNMNQKMREIETQLDEVKVSCRSNESGLKQVQEEVTKLAGVVEAQNKKVEEARAAAATAGSSSIFEELRERESKRCNVIMHGMGEAPPDCTGRARWDWDLQSCDNLFKALQIPIKIEAIRFVRRVGEPGPRPRPLVVGFHEERDKTRLLRVDTRRTRFSDVDIVPDLTKAQRQEEDDMRAEMVARNTNLCSEDRSKNLAWLVVGPRGAKRLVKKRIDYDEEIASGRRPPRGPPVARDSRPRPQAEAQPSGAEVEMVEVEAVSETLLDPPATGRGRLGSKRGRGGSADAEEPPQARQRQ